MAIVSSKEVIAGLYVGAFNRSPDQEGVDFWQSQANVAINAGTPVKSVYQEIMSRFVTNSVFINTYDGLDDNEFVQQIYQNMLGQAGDAKGIVFWEDLLNQGVSRGDMIADFVRGALTFDPADFPDLSASDLQAANERQALLANKVEVSLYFVDTLGASTNLVSNTGETDTSDPAYLASIKVLRSVTDDIATKEIAKKLIDLAKVAADLNHISEDDLNADTVINLTEKVTDWELDSLVIKNENITVNLLDNHNITFGLTNGGEGFETVTINSGEVDNSGQSATFRALTLSNFTANPYTLTLATGAHLDNSDDSLDSDTVGPPGSDPDSANTIYTGTQAPFASSLILTGAEDIIIEGTAEQLDEANIVSLMTTGSTFLSLTSITGGTTRADATSALATDGDAVNLDNAKVDYVLVNASNVGSNQLADISVDNDTIIEVNKIGSGGTLYITGDADMTDDLEVIINTGSIGANLGNLILGGDAISDSELPVFIDEETRTVDANNTEILVSSNSILNTLDISALLGKTIIAGGNDFSINNGLIFDDSDTAFDTSNALTQTGVGFGGDWLDATAMSGDFRAVLRDGNISTTPNSNDNNGIRADLGTGDDILLGVGTAVSVAGDGTESGDKINMGAGDDKVVIGVNDTGTNTLANIPNVGSVDSLNNQVFNNSTPTQAAEDAYNLANSASLAHDRINAEIFLGSGQDTIIFENQNSGFLASSGGIRILDFEAGSGGDIMGFQMFQKGKEDGLSGIDNIVTQSNLDLFFNGQIIADTDVGLGGKYIINGYDANDNGFNDSTTLFTPLASQLGIGIFDGEDTGANDGNVVFISTNDISNFSGSSASNLWASNGGSSNGVFKDVVNTGNSGSSDGHQYETILLVGETSGSVGVKIFYVTDETVYNSSNGTPQNVDGAPTASLVGFLEGININDLDADNFDFI